MTNCLLVVFMYFTFLHVGWLNEKNDFNSAQRLRLRRQLQLDFSHQSNICFLFFFPSKLKYIICCLNNAQRPSVQKIFSCINMKVVNMQVYRFRYGTREWISKAIHSVLSLFAKNKAQVYGFYVYRLYMVYYLYKCLMHTSGNTLPYLM